MLKVKSVYRHFKGKYYYVENIAFDSESLKKVVIYRPLYDQGDLYIRDYEMFISEVDKEKYPEVTQKYRFELIEF